MVLSCFRCWDSSAPYLLCLCCSDHLPSLTKLWPDCLESHLLSPSEPDSSSAQPYLQASILFCSHLILHPLSVVIFFSFISLSFGFTIILCLEQPPALPKWHTLPFLKSIHKILSFQKSSYIEFSTNDVASLGTWTFVHVSHLSKWEPWGGRGMIL